MKDLERSKDVVVLLWVCPSQLKPTPDSTAASYPRVDLGSSLSPPFPDRGGTANTQIRHSDRTLERLDKGVARIAQSRIWQSDLC